MLKKVLLNIKENVKKAKEMDIREVCQNGLWKKAMLKDPNTDIRLVGPWIFIKLLASYQNLNLFGHCREIVIQGLPQGKYNPITDETLEIYDHPAGKADTIAMQHEINYTVFKDDRKCKNKAERKMVKALDNVPYEDRQ